MRIIVSGGRFGAKRLVNYGWSWVHADKNNLESIDLLCRKFKITKSALLNVFQKNHDVFRFHGFFAVAIPVIHDFEGKLSVDSILVLVKRNLIITFSYSSCGAVINDVAGTVHDRVRRGFNELFILRRLLQEAHEDSIKLIDRHEEVIDRLVEGAAILKIEISDLVQLVLKNRRYLSRIKEVLHDFKRLLFDIDEELPAVFEKSGDLRKIGQLSAEVSEELNVLYTLEQKLSEALSLRDLLLTNRMNSIATKLTIIAAIFLVPTLISGIFGMNNLFDPVNLFTVGALTINTMHLEFMVIGLAMLVILYFIYNKGMLKL